MSDLISRQDVPDTNVGDMISRQDAINTSLEFFVEYLGGAFDENSQKELMVRLQRLSSAEPETRLVAEVTMTKDHIQDAVDKAVEKIRTEMKEPEPHWIPCSERLPELDDEVLVTDDRGELGHCIFCTWGETRCKFITYEKGMRIKPVAWMPLPSPYQPEEESE